MKRFLLFLILPLLLSAQPASRISLQDTLRAYLADTIYAKNRFRFTAITRFDSSVTFLSSSTINPRWYLYSAGIDTIVTRSSSQMYMQTNSVYGILSGPNMTAEPVSYLNVFGTLLHLKYHTVGGFAYANSKDSVEFGHATISGGVPFIAFATTGSSNAGLTSAGYGFKSDTKDTSSWWFQMYNGDPGTGSGTTTTGFQLTKFKGNGNSSNYYRYDGSKYLVFWRIDTSNNIKWNDAKSGDFTYGYMQLSNGNFIVSNGSVASDSMLSDAGTWRTTTYHSGLVSSAFGNFTAGTGTFQGLITGNAGLSTTTGTFSSTVTLNGNSTGNFLINNSTGTPASINVYSNTATTGSAMQFNRARGTSNSSYSAINSGDVIFALFGSGAYSGAAFSGNTGAIRLMAGENYSATNQGTYIDFAVTDIGATSRTVSAILDRTGSAPRLTIGSTAGTGSGPIIAGGLSSFGTNAGTATIGAGDSVQVTVTGLTVATGQAVVWYKRKGATSVVVADTIATYDINTADKLSIYGKYGWTVSYWVGKK